MKMKLAPALALLCVCVLSGCTFTGRLYPVQGPLSSQLPPPIFTLNLTGMVNPQTLSTVLSNGEIFKGIWTVPSVKTRAERAAAGKPQLTNLASTWDTVYGPGFYTAHVLGTRYFAQASITGNQGTLLQVEMYRLDTGAETDLLQAIKGVAKDSKGNEYKLAF